LQHGLRVVQGRVNECIGGPPGGTLIGMVHYIRANPETLGFQSDHPAQLATAGNPEPMVFRIEAHADGSRLSSSTRRVCDSRQDFKRARTFSSFRATIDAASNPAFTAPEVPMASVPTGTPRGICTMESRESIPLRARDCTGTPRTGRTVRDAVMPGRWAAPPAPAMMTCRPRSSAVSAYRNSLSGVR